MVKAKRTKPREHLIRSHVSTPAKFIDFAYAPDAAERQVAEGHEINATLRDRLVAIRED
jgi:hypothetical protein